MSGSMTRATASKSDALMEIWHSFASLLKSYAAAASLNGAEHGVLVLSDSSLNIVAGRATLSVGYYATLNRGAWSMTEGTDRHQYAEQPREVERGNFDINADGTIALDGNTIDMDHAAIQLVAALTVAASRNVIEVFA
jgi:hypothetical protein